MPSTAIAPSFYFLGKEIAHERAGIEAEQRDPDRTSRSAATDVAV